MADMNRSNREHYSTTGQAVIRSHTSDLPFLLRTVLGHCASPACACTVTTEHPLHRKCHGRTRAGLKTQVGGLHERSGGSWNRLRRLRPPLRGNSNGLLDSSCVPLLLTFVNLFALKSISLVCLILHNVHENLPPHNSNHPDGQNRLTQVPVPSTFMRTRHLEYFFA
jgi:hypothetical protein